MKVSKEIKSLHGSKIQIADCRHGGNSSWAEKDGESESSIRLAWFRDEGQFDPISSAELPLWGLKELLKTAAKNDVFEKKELAEMIGELTASVYRQV